MEVTDWIAVAAPLTTLGGVALGAFLSRQTARDLAKDQREWTERQAVRAREDQVAAEFDGRLHEIIMDVPRGVVSNKREAEKVYAGQMALRTAWQRTIALDDPDIEARVSALDMALFIGGQDAHFLAEGDAVNLYPIDVAARDLRRALGAFQRREPIPEAEFPTSSKLIQLAHGGGQNRGLDGVREWLIERGVT